MATTAKEKIAALQQRIAVQDERVAKLEARGDSATMLAEIKAGQQRIEEALRGLVKVIPEAMLSTPVPLKADEIRLILRDNPSAKFKTIGSAPQLKLRPNEVFEAQHRFQSTARFCSYVEGGNLRVLAA